MIKWIRSKQVCTALNYIEHFFVLASAVTECVLISVFASSVEIPICIVSSSAGLTICAITAGIKKYKVIIKKKKKITR